MEQADSEQNVSSSFIASVISPPNNFFPKVPSENPQKLNPDSLNVSQQKPVPAIKLPTYEHPWKEPSKSNYSSINNILPCSETELLSKRTDEGLVQNSEPQISDRLKVPQPNSKSPSLTNLKPKTQEVTGAEKPPLKMIKPPLNPNEIARGLNVLHRKVDELLKNKSFSRAGSRDSSFDDKQEMERPQRASSTDGRTETANFASGLFFTPVKKPQPFKSNSSYKDNNYADMNSNRSVNSIDVDRNKGFDESRIINCLSINRSHIREKPVSPIKGRNSVPINSLQVLPSHFDTNILRDHERLMRKSPIRSEVYDTKREGAYDPDLFAKPKYDEKKLEEILNRIKERNCVSPVPTRKENFIHDSGLPQKAYSAQVNRYETRRTNDEFSTRRETRPEDRFVTHTTWQVSMIAKEENTSLDEIEDEIEDLIPQRTSIIANSAMKEDPALSSRERGDTHQRNERDVPKISIVPATENSGRESQYQSKVSKNEEELNMKEEMNIHSETKKSFEKNTENEKSPHISQRSNDFVEKEGTEKVEHLIEEEANQTTYFCGDVENDLDSVFDPMTTGDLRRQEDLRLGSAQCTERITEICSEERRESKRLRTIDTEVVYKSAEKSRFSRRTEVPFPLSSAKSNETLDTRRRSVEKVEKVNDIRLSQDSGRKIYRQPNSAEKVIPLNNGRPYVYQQENDQTRKIPYRNQSPVKMTEDELLTLDASIFSMKEGSIFTGIDSQRAYFSNSHPDRQTTQRKECVRPELNVSSVRNRFLEDEELLSDFDFERNRLESEISVESSRALKLRLCKFEQDFEDQTGLKRFKVMADARQGFLESQFLHDKVVPKLDIAKARKLV